MKNPFRYFNNSQEVIRLTVMLYILYLLNTREIFKQNRSAALAG